MRSLVISITALALVLVPWTIFAIHLQGDLWELHSVIGNELIPQLQQEDWPGAEKNFLYIKEVWETNHPFYLFFLDGESIGQVQQSLVRLEASLSNMDSATAIIELLSIDEDLFLLYENELPTIENIF